jgi:hypothetical protein
MLCLLLALTWCGDNQTEDLDKLLEAARAKDRESAYAESGKLWEKVTHANPYQGQYWLRQGDAYRRANQLDQAIPAYLEAHRLGAGVKGSIAYTLACCYALQDKRDQSVQWLDKSLSQGFRNTALILTDKDLLTIRQDKRYQALVSHFQPAPTSRIEGWQHDLHYYYTELKRRHPDLYRLHTPSEFDEYVQRLQNDIPTLNDAQLETRFIRLAAMAGAGHTSLRPGSARKVTPWELYQFGDGIAVVAAAPEHADLVGSYVLKVGEHEVNDAIKMVTPLISWDSPMSFQAVGPMLLSRPRLLFGLGLIPSENEVNYTVRNDQLQQRQITLKTQTLKDNEQVDTTKWVKAQQKNQMSQALYLKDRKKNYWFEHLIDKNLVFCQYNAVQNTGPESFEKFCDRLFRFIDEHKVENLVIDIRFNGGGNSFLNRPLIENIIRSSRINQQGKLFVIIGRQTFSAAQNCATDLELHTKAIFVGEPTGSSPNSIGESIRVTLPYSKMTGTMSDLRWWRGWPMDERVWIPPQLAAPPTLSALLENRDPAMEAILHKIQAPQTK